MKKMKFLKIKAREKKPRQAWLRKGKGFSHSHYNNPAQSAS